MTATAPNPFEVSGRLKKAYELARILFRAEISPEAAERMTPAEWAAVARAAKVNQPSDETKQLVYQKLAKLAEPIDWMDETKEVYA